MKMKKLAGYVVNEMYVEVNQEVREKKTAQERRVGEYLKQIRKRKIMIN